MKEWGQKWDPVAKAAGGARPGGTTGSRRNRENPAWSVTDEDFAKD